MLIALFLLYVGSLFGSGSGDMLMASDDVLMASEAYRDQVQVIIIDEATQKAVLAEMDSMSAAGRSLCKDLSSELQEWSKADIDHTAGKDSYRSLTEKLTERKGAARKEYLDALFRMKSKMSRDQWDKVFVEESAAP